MIGQAKPMLRPPAESLSAGNFRSSAIDEAPAVLAYASPARSASARRFKFSPGKVVSRGGPNDPPLCEMAPSNSPFAKGDAHSMLTAIPPGRLAENGHTAGIAAECADILPHPLESRDHIQQTVVPGYVPAAFGA